MENVDKSSSPIQNNNQSEAVKTSQSGDKKTLYIVLAVLAVVFLCCGCGVVATVMFGSLAESTTTDVGNDDFDFSEDETVSEPQVDTDPDFGNSGTTDFALPAGITLYPGIEKVLKTGDYTEGTGFYTYSGLIEFGSENLVYKHYVDQLKAAGWTITAETDDFGQTVIAEKGNLGIIVSAEGSYPTRNTITITVK